MTPVMARMPDGLDRTTDVGRPTSIDITLLVETHADFVWRSLRRLGVRTEGADDATQQVFLITQKNLARITEGRERGFLFGVAMNVAAHARRSAARRREVAAEEAFEVVDPRPLPDAALDEHRARALLDEVLEAMPIDLRTVFVMFELEEMSMAEIAEVLAIPPGTVASRLRRAREDFHRVAQRVRARASLPNRDRVSSVNLRAEGRVATAADRTEARTR